MMPPTQSLSEPRAAAPVHTARKPMRLLVTGTEGYLGSLLEPFLMQR